MNKSDVPAESVVPLSQEEPEAQVLELIGFTAWIPDCDWTKVQKSLGRTEHCCQLHPGLTVTVYVHRQHLDPVDPDITSLKASVWPDEDSFDLEQLNSAAHPVRTLRSEFTTDDGIRVQFELDRASWEVINDGWRHKEFKKVFDAQPERSLEELLG
ncbi:MAG: hypothetical protein KBB55_01970 [Candidatus Buchananbacteria bacterium]|nr:hypothetical protein [Candidatus Buchananbacteria bacterium]